MRDEEGFIVRAGAVAAAGLALLGLFVAACTSSLGCGTTDGTFSIHDAGARPSALCRVTHFPHVFDSPTSVLIAGGLYLGPAIILGIGTIVSRTAETSRPLRTSAWIAALWMVAVAVASFTAHVGYAGV